MEADFDRLTWSGPGAFVTCARRVAWPFSGSSGAGSLPSLADGCWTALSGKSIRFPLSRLATHRASMSAIPSFITSCLHELCPAVLNLYDHPEVLISPGAIVVVLNHLVPTLEQATALRLIAPEADSAKSAE